VVSIAGNIERCTALGTGSQYLTNGLTIFLTSEIPCHTLNAVVNKPEKVTAVFAALADPTRRRIVQHLSEQGESRVTALAKPFRISLPAVSRHLRVLENARLIKRRRQGREHLIRSDVAGLEEARKWIAQCAVGWESGFDTLDELLKDAQRSHNEREKAR
jgi:DNA-binding transcriptional ArsR family regulator